MKIRFSATALAIAEKSVHHSDTNRKLPTMKLRPIFRTPARRIAHGSRSLCPAARRPGSTTRPNTVSRARQREALYRGLAAQNGCQSPILISRTPLRLRPCTVPASFPAASGSGYMRGYIDRGYIVVMQDVRGRFMSEARFVHVRHGYGETDRRRTF